MNINYFPGGNTGRGFVNLFDGIIAPWEKGFYTYILKGGPGVGKNTLMKKVVERANRLGLDVELFYCASDSESLDAVKIIQNKIVVLDGTAPHMIDPIYPGAVDEIINLGHFKNQRKFGTYLNEIEDLLGENKLHYTIAYSYLRSAMELKNNTIEIIKSAMNIDKLDRWLLEKIGKNDGENVGTRRLFSSAITPDGIIDLSDSDFDVKLSGFTGLVAMNRLQKIVGGRKKEMFLDPLGTFTPKSINLLNERLTFVTDYKDGESECDEFLIKKEYNFISCVITQIDNLIRNATDELFKCKAVHCQVEQLYRAFVDYDKVNDETEKLMFKIGL